MTALALDKRDALGAGVHRVKAEFIVDNHKMFLLS